jgi:hypothetical protein
MPRFYFETKLMETLGNKAVYGNLSGMTKALLWKDI